MLNWSASVEKNSTSRGYRMTLFSQGKDAARELWDGARYSSHLPSMIVFLTQEIFSSSSHADLQTHFQADAAQPISSFPATLRSLMALSSHVYVDAPPPPPRKRGNVLGFLQGQAGAARAEFDSVVDGLSGSRKRALAPEVGRLRAIKSPVEQKVMRAAADISGMAHAKVICANTMIL
jgi:intermediate cleaving peptidase 55